MGSVPNSAEPDGSGSDSPWVDVLCAARGDCGISREKPARQVWQYLLHVAAHELSPQLRAKMGPSDLVQETLLRARRGISQFRGETEEELKAWLRTIMKRVARTADRRYLGTQKRASHREVSLPASSSILDLRELQASSEDNAANGAIKHEQVTLLRSALARLSADYQQVLKLREFERLPFAQIAVAMNRSVAAVRQLWVSAIKRLRKEMEQGDAQTIR